jgi:hypothetical protein
MQKLGEVLSIQIAPQSESLPQSVDQVRAVAGMGLEGDRYYLRTGTYSKKHDESREATLIESEALEALEREYGHSAQRKAAATSPRVAWRSTTWLEKNFASARLSCAASNCANPAATSSK